MTLARPSLCLIGLTCLTLLPFQAQAQLAPTPQKSPRTPVHRENLSSGKPALPASRTLEGPALVLDAERLKVADIELRLFGVVPPQLGASFGPQARHVVDVLAQGGVTCHIRDRDRDGRLLASCQNTHNADLGIELLRRGLAVTARGSLRPTELAAPYIAAEDAAKAQRLGLWSVALPAAASESSIKEAAQKAAEPKPEAVKDEPKKEAPAQQPAAAAPAQTEEVAPPPALPVTPTDSNGKTSPLPATKPDNMAHVTLGPSAAEIQALLDTPRDDATAALEAPKPFLERYQLLASSLVTLLTALTCAASFVFVRARDKRNELRAIAAALRGELMSARAICLARLSKIAKEGQEKATGWPRIRTLVFQAYVGQLGRLGADLARQIASIYGQASDYASYYVGAEAKPEAASKKQALQTLVQHIEEVVPKLVAVEKDGLTPRPDATPALPALLGRVTKPAALAAPLKAALPPSDDPKPRAPLPAPESSADDKEDKATTASSPAAEAEKTEEAKAAPSANEETTANPLDEKKDEKEKSVKSAEVAATTADEKATEATKPAEKRIGSGSAKPATARAVKKATPPVQAAPVQAAPVQAAPVQAAPTQADASPATKTEALALRFHEASEKLKGLLAEQWNKLQPQPAEDVLPDYANLTEEEIDALVYAEEDPFAYEPPGKARKIG